MKLLNEDEIISKCLEIIDGFGVPNRTWGQLLFGEGEKTPTLLKDLAFPIYCGCVRDLALAINHEKDRTRVFRSLDTIQDHIFVNNVRQIFGLGVFAAEVLCRLPQEEQIFLEFCRNRLVHGYLDGETKDQKLHTIIARPNREQSPFREVTLEKEAKQAIISSLGGPDILSGAKKMRGKYEGIFKVFYQKISVEMGIDTKRLEPHLRNGNLIFTVSQDDYQEFVRSLDRASDNRLGDVRG